MSVFLRMEGFPDATAYGRLRVVSAGDPAVLLDIVRPSVGLAVWARKPDDAWIADSKSFRGDKRHLAAANVLPPDIADVLARQAQFDFPGWLHRDVARLAGFLSVVGGSPSLSAGFGCPAADDPGPDGLQLFCCYGGDPVRWFHHDGNGMAGPGGAIDPFAVAILKRAHHSSGHNRTIRIEVDPPRAIGPVLLIEPYRGAWGPHPASSGSPG